MVESEKNNSTPKRLFTEADFDGSRPTPFRLNGQDADKATVDRQDVLIANMEGGVRQELQGIVSDEVVNFVVTGIVSRMHMREALNSHSFSNRLHKLPLPWLVKDHPWLETLSGAHATIRGARTVEQSDVAQRAFGMQSVEYRNLTMFGNFRRDLEDPMWDEISDFVGQDARPSAQDVYRTKLLGFKGDLMKPEPIDAMRIELKSSIPGGEREDGTIVKVRSTASINTSVNSAFDQDVLASLREHKFEFEKGRSKVELSENPEFLTYVGYLIDNALPGDLVLARNETVFGGNNEIAAKIHARNERRRNIKALMHGQIRKANS